jgi:uncharacterized protein (UPF0548 family)
MFLARRPPQEAIDRFISDSRELPVSYSPIGIARTAGENHAVEVAAVIGCGQADFDRARAALMAWEHFDVGWIDIFPRCASVDAGTVVAVLIRHLGFWSLCGNRVVLGGRDEESGRRFAFAIGTLTNHAESGEELFEVVLEPGTDDVIFRIRAVAQPRARLARFGAPLVRALQARFRRDAIAAMKRATRSVSI